MILQIKYLRAAIADTSLGIVVGIVLSFMANVAMALGLGWNVHLLAGAAFLLLTALATGWLICLYREIERQVAAQANEKNRGTIPRIPVCDSRGSFAAEGNL